ncbi:hypothetical protein [Haloarcula sebkhae]|uniref:Uncharacterized protein n=2 Tax=Haloarcula sebkhae TaxID=932660 RepID=A0A830EWZ7_9EURY|nr:hypothetical protein [Haloarcula sebkhae]GGK83838.1 hypothetical protein GCM10009067_39930 [Haloarcula sebkhae]
MPSTNNRQLLEVCAAGIDWLVKIVLVYRWYVGDIETNTPACWSVSSACQRVIGERSLRDLRGVFDED